MITFIVTTYNLEEHLLRHCLESIVAQGLERNDYEIIVVDDESDISPQHIVEEFTDRADIHLYTQRHSRQGAARNLALQYARGEWVEFVDGDDYLFAQSVAPCLAIAEDNKLDLLMFSFREVEGVNTEATQQATVCKEIIVTTGNEYMTEHNLFGCCWPLLIHRTLLDGDKKNEPLRFAEGVYIEDEEFVTRLVWRAQRMAKTDNVVYAYYQRPGSTVNNRNRSHTDELFANYFVALRRMLDFEASIATQPHEGVTRKVRLFAVDILRRALREEDWRERWEQSAQQLRPLGLYPIPHALYSWKYRVFGLLARCKMGRKLLQIIERR